MGKISKKYFGWLKGEAELWHLEGLISKEQAAKIIGRYQPLEAEEKGNPSKLITAISILEALLVGAGVILFISSNWELIPKVWKLAMVFGVILGVNHTGYYLKYTKENYPKIGSALIFLGALLFGAGIWLIAQIYHITSRYHSGIIFWGLGILPVAWMLGFESILVFSSGLLTFWTIYKSVDFSTPNYPYIILMLSVILPLCYKQKAKIALFISLVGISLWLGIGHFSFLASHGSRPYPSPEPGTLVILCSTLLGVLLYSIGNLHPFFHRSEDYQYKLSGILNFFVPIYFLSFKDITDNIKDLVAKPLPTPFWYTWGILLILALCSLAATILLSRKEPSSHYKTLSYENIFLVIFTLFPVLILILPNAIFYAVTSNILLLALTVGIIFYGYQNEQASFINLGFVFFAVHFLTRYFDWAYKYLPRSLFFTVTGAILILIATLLEKKRRKLIEAMRQEK